MGGGNGTPGAFAALAASAAGATWVDLEFGSADEELIGQTGVVRETLDPVGTVFVHGEIWRARTDDPPLHAGETVRVEAVADGLVLEVGRAEAPVVVTA